MSVKAKINGKEITFELDTSLGGSVSLRATHVDGEPTTGGYLFRILADGTFNREEFVNQVFGFKLENNSWIQEGSTVPKVEDKPAVIKLDNGKKIILKAKNDWEGNVDIVAYNEDGKELASGILTTFTKKGFHRIGSIEKSIGFPVNSEGQLKKDKEY